MRRSPRFTPIAAIFVALSFSLTACVQAPEGPKVSGPAPATEAPESPAEFVPGGSAEENLPYFDATLRAYAQSDAPLEGVPIVDAVVAAGFDKNNMQVSFDESKTGHTADSMYVAVRIDQSCLIGQLVAADRSYVAVTEPAVGPDKNVCLIGETRPIDW